jgi:uncharacterized membrane protein
MDSSLGFPAVNMIDVAAPFRWLAGGWSDMRKALWPCLAYGLVLAALSIAGSAAFVASNAAFWVLALSCGFVFIAPILAMGLYEAGRLIEQGQTPTLARMVFVRQAVRQDVVYLGLALLMIYLMWGRIAQIVYGLSTYSFHRTVEGFVAFALGTAEGHAMLVSGTAVGGAIAFFTYCLVVIAAPMLLDSKTTVWAASAASFAAVAKNPGPMLLWAALIVGLLLVSAATAFLGLIVIFPWLGLATWRAYRDLVPDGAREHASRGE